MNYREYQELNNKKIYGIFVEDLFSLIDSVLEEDGGSFKVNLDFIMSEFLMEGNRYKGFIHYFKLSKFNVIIIIN